MAAPAGGGGSAVSVLAPNGRRHTVKVTPSTVLLQVRPPARVGNGRTDGRAEGPRWPRPGPPLRLLPGLRGGAGPWWAVLEAANRCLSRGCPPHSVSGSRGRGGMLGGAFLDPRGGWGPHPQTVLLETRRLRRLSEFSLLGHQEEGRPCLLRSGASLRTLDRPRPWARK